jgi:hypothetical protein
VGAGLSVRGPYVPGATSNILTNVAETAPILRQNLHTIIHIGHDVTVPASARNQRTSSGL